MPQRAAFGSSAFWSTPSLMHCFVFCKYLRRRFCDCGFLVLARLFGFLLARLVRFSVTFGFCVAQRFGSGAAFGFLHLARSGSSASTLVAQQAAIPTHQLQHNKALHPTAYSFAPSSLRLPAAVELGRCVAARGLMGYDRKNRRRRKR